MTIRNKRIGRAMLAAMILCGSIMPLGERSRVYADFAGEGCGDSEYDACIITSVAQLREIGEVGNLGKSFELGADLDLGAIANWDPIASFAQPFTGTLDGRGHTIANLKIDTGGAGTSWRGLFGGSDNATFKNIGLINVSIEAADGDYIGGLVGDSRQTTFENVYVTGSVSGGTNVGGLAGYAQNGAIRYSYSAVTVAGVDTDAKIGGVVGSALGSVVTVFTYYNTELTTDSPVGLPLTTEEMTDSDSFNGIDWNFSGDSEEGWAILEGVTYPMHRVAFNRLALGSLEVADGDDPIAFEPEFRADRFAYTATVPNAVASVTVSASAEGDVSVNGGSDPEIVLDEGENQVDLAVSNSDAAIPAPGALANPFVVGYTLTIIREDGSDEHPHSIATAEQLGAIGTGNYELDDAYRLMNDIDLTDYLIAGGGGYHLGAGWDPIGDEANPFTGVFEGNKHRIKNLFIDRDGEDNAGLFAVLAGTVNQLGLAHADITGNGNVGGIAGEIDGGTITRSYVTGKITAIGDRSGGLAGSLSSGNVTEAYSAAAVTANDDAGGLIGYGENDGVTDSLWDTATSGQETSGGGSGAVGKATADMQSKSVYQAAGWDFAATWAIIDGTTYPMFQSGFEAVKLDSLHVEAAADVLDWNPGTFEPGKGAYTVISDKYITAVDVSASPADSDTTVTIDGTADASVTVPVTPGDNVIDVVTTDVNGFAQGVYKFTIQVPPPEPIDVEPPLDGYYGIGDTLTFIVTYEGDVDVTGEPQIPLAIGNGADTETVYADFAGHPDGEPNKLIFEYAVEAGFVDPDGIAVGAAIALTGDAEITASDAAVPLDLPSTDTDGIKIDSVAPLIVITQDPDNSTLTREKVKLTIDTDGTGSDIAEVRWADGRWTETDFDSGGTVLLDDFFEVEENGEYTVFAKDEVGNRTVETLEVNNIVTEAPQILLIFDPSAATKDPVTVSVTASAHGSANLVTKLNWMPGSRGTGDFADGAAGTDILGTSEFEVATNGTYTVYARDAAGNEAVEEIVIGNIAITASPVVVAVDPVQPDKPPAVAKAPDGSIAIVINPSDIVKETREDGTVIEKVALTDEVIRQLLELLETASSPLVTIGIDDSEGAVQVQFPASSLGSVLESFPDAVFEVRLSGSSFQLQVHVLDLEGLAERLGVDPAQMQVHVVMEQVTGADKQQLEQVAGKQGLRLVGQAVAYTLAASAGGQTVEIKDFGGTYMVRTLVLGGAAPGARLTAVLYDPVGRTFFFVPAVLATGNGNRQEMSIKTPHNSIYAVVEVENKSFADLAGHWAQEDAELLASKLIVQGVSATVFAPDSRITRAEFTALLVRALGIRMEGAAGKLVFQDVDRDDWYASMIEAGVNAGLVNGVSSNRFAPNSEITREQMAVMVANALAIAGRPGMDGNRAESLLHKFSDRADISSWATMAVAQAVEAGIIAGMTEDTIAPSEYATRAQAAVMLKRLLQFIAFIDI